MKELVERVRANKVNYKEIILKTLFACTVLSVSLIAPNALKMFSFLKTKEKYQTRHRLKFKTNELIKNGYVKKIQNKLELTEKGEAELLKFSDYAHKKPKKWDGIWTIVSFDFPINKGRARDVVRFHLKRIGFIQLQQSIWVYPYDCSKLIYLMKAEWNIKDEIVYIRAKYISREKKLKEIFGL